MPVNVDNAYFSTTAFIHNLWNQIKKQSSTNASLDFIPNGNTAYLSTATCINCLPILQGVVIVDLLFHLFSGHGNIMYCAL